MSSMEQAVRELWHRWAPYRQYGICACCKEPRYVGRTARSRWLCLDCFDGGER
jgi:hypothetical protein